MFWLPYINDYKPFYIQAKEDSAAWDTTVYGLIAKSSPYSALPEPKDVYKNDYKDEDGDDEYNTEMYYKSFTFKVKFYIKAYASGTRPATDVLRSQMAAFFGHIRNGEFSVYDAYTGLGRRKVRYAGYEEADGGFKARDDWARLIFSITFKVNDPVTAMTLTDGKIVEIE